MIKNTHEVKIFDIGHALGVTIKEVYGERKEFSIVISDDQEKHVIISNAERPTGMMHATKLLAHAIKRFFTE